MDNGKDKSQTNTFLSDSDFRCYYKRCVVFAKSYIYDEQESECMASEALTMMWRKLKEEGVEIEYPLSYLFTIIRNKALHFLRHKYVVQRAREEIESESTKEIQFRIGTLEACDPHALYSTEVQSILRATLDSFSEQDRTVFSLSRFKGKKNREIAEMLGISEKSVEYHISKVLKVLRTNLKDYLPMISIFLQL